MAAVAFLGEDFSFVNGIGLVVLVAGVAVFNVTKYSKHVASMNERGSRTPKGITEHRRTSSDALESFDHLRGGDYGAEKGLPVSPLTAARESSIKLQAASISGPASHRRDLTTPPV